MSPSDELQLFGWAIGAGIFLSLLTGVALRVRARLPARRLSRRRKA